MNEKYVVFERRPKIVQISWDDILYGDLGNSDFYDTDQSDLTGTITHKVANISKRLAATTDVFALTSLLQEFVTRHGDLLSVDEHELFDSFMVKKRNKGMKSVFDAIFKSQKRYITCNASEICRNVSLLLGPVLSRHSEVDHQKTYSDCKQAVLSYLGENGFDVGLIDFDTIVSNSFRKISAPVPRLAGALTELKNMFENEFCDNTLSTSTGLPKRKLYHTSAFAYIKRRSTLSDIRKHQSNCSRWFASFDLTNFFGSTTIDFTMRMMEKVFPFSEIIKYNTGRNALYKALSLAFLDGGLPQGTQISPLITNIIMIPFDFEFSKKLRNIDGSSYVYTRYADDFLVSNRKSFNVKDIEHLIIDTLSEFDAPFTIKTSKTKYGSSAGRNWHLGLMLNKDNQITVGHENKRNFRAQISSYVMDKLHGKQWSISEIQAMEGIRSYYSMIEGESINAIIQKVDEKFGVDSLKMVKSDLREYSVLTS